MTKTWPSSYCTYNYFVATLIIHGI